MLAKYEIRTYVGSEHIWVGKYKNLHNISHWHLEHALIMSGIAMQMMGNSRPASGAEHHVSHMTEMKPAAFEVLSACPQPFNVNENEAADKFGRTHGGNKKCLKN